MSRWIFSFSWKLFFILFPSPLLFYFDICFNCSSTKITRGGKLKCHPSLRRNLEGWIFFVKSLREVTRMYLSPKFFEWWNKISKFLYCFNHLIWKPHNCLGEMGHRGRGNISWWTQIHTGSLELSWRPNSNLFISSPASSLQDHLTMIASSAQQFLSKAFNTFCITLLPFEAQRGEITC